MIAANEMKHDIISHVSCAILLKNLYCIKNINIWRKILECHQNGQGFE